MDWGNFAIVNLAQAKNPIDMANLNQSNHEAIELFYKHSEKLQRYVRSRINSEEDAEDLVQDVFLRLLEYPGEIVAQSAGNLAFSIASHVVNDYLRHQYVKTSVHSNISATQTGISNETENAVVGRDMQRFERRHLNAMPAQRRLIYIMRIHQGKTTKEIADALHISPRTAENHFYIGIRQMRQSFSAAI